MKIRTVEDLMDRINEDLSWRKKEINDLYLYAKPKSEINRKTFIRAGLSLLYAHWEGFIKESSIKYLTYVKTQKMKYNELKPNFLTIKFYNELRKCLESDKQSLYYDTLENILCEIDHRANFNEYQAVKTESNLTSENLISILKVIGFEVSLFELKHNLIDEKLIKNRNEIVHGENVQFDLTVFTELKDTTIDMLNTFRDTIENAAYNRHFIK